LALQDTACYLRAGRELWISDGSDIGTVRLVDIAPGTENSDPGYITTTSVAGGSVFFAATVRSFGRELWVTDGTPANTHMFADVFLGIGSANPTFILDVPGVRALLQRAFLSSLTRACSQSCNWCFSQPATESMAASFGQQLVFSSQTIQVRFCLHACARVFVRKPRLMCASLVYEQARSWFVMCATA
jgi:ELWxxDGT repeat protein